MSRLVGRFCDLRRDMPPTLLGFVWSRVFKGRDTSSVKLPVMGLKVRRDELAREVADLSRRMASDEPPLTREKVERLGLLLRDKLQHGSAELRQAHARLVIGEVTADEREIRIGGSKAVLARCTAEPPGEAPPAVLSFVQEWRTRQDSNL